VSSSGSSSLSTFVSTFLDQSLDWDKTGGFPSLADDRQTWQCQRSKGISNATNTFLPFFL
jgi:hypothetical protein